LDEKGNKIKKDRFKGLHHKEVSADDVAELFWNAKNILIVPGFGMA
jgi:NAD/NADP transhydrogenase beta subunit